MLSDEQKIKQKEKKKKILVIAVLSVIGLFVMMGLITFIASGIRNSIVKPEAEKPRQSYIFVNPDYNLNIFEDEYYMQLNREFGVFDGNSRTVINDDNFKSYCPELNFMRHALEYVIAGNYTEYNKIFTEEYLNGAGDELREIFTMQQLYNIELEVIAYDTVRSDGGRFTTKSAIKVSYMIRNNNGTFRNDLPEEARVPVVYLLTSETDADNNTEIKVTNLVKYSVAYD